MKAYGWCGLILLLISEYCLFQKIEPFHSWFYCFAWWSYILLADNLLLKLSGRSILTRGPRELWAMFPLSVFIWLIFEGYNFILRNWAYDGVIANPWLRWPGYALAFATVLPGIFVTSDLAEHLLFRRPSDRGAREPLSNRATASESEALIKPPDSRISPFFLLAGALLTLAPLVWPRFFFATIWIGPVFLLDPLLEKLGVQSLSLSIVSGKRRRIWSLLTGGLACGVMWEFWNFWASSRWVYTVPYLGDLKVFEMPALGFLGFPPFAVECWILYHLLQAILCRCGNGAIRAAAWLAILALGALILYGIDRLTVLRYAGLFPGGPETCLFA